MSLIISNKLFELRSSEKFNDLKTSFLDTIKKIRWNKEKAINEIVEYYLYEIAAIPNDPFSENLINHLEWEYGALCKDINDILDKVEIIRKELLSKERKILFKNKFYNFPLITKNIHIKEQIILDGDGDICYITRNKLDLKLKYLFYSWFAKTQKERETFEKKFLGLIPEVLQRKELFIYCYSQFINIHVTDKEKYFEFYIDYYSKKLFRDFINEYIGKQEPSYKLSIDKNTSDCFTKNSSVKFDVKKFTNAQIVLLTYFYLKELGVEPRVGSYVSTMIRFIHIITQANYTKAKNSVFYKMAMKAPNFKTDKNLIKDLEIVKKEFQRVELPIDKVEEEILQAKKKF